MAQASGLSSKYEMQYKTKFTGPIHGHHIYKDCWAPFIGKRLDCKPDSRTEALTYDKYALGVYKHVEDKEQLVGLCQSNFRNF